MMTFDESSSYFPNWMALWVDFLLNQNRFEEAEQLALSMSDKPISDSWRRQFLVRLELARQHLPSTYFDDDFGLVDRIGWLNSGVFTGSVRSYLLAVNWFSTQQFQQVLEIPIAEDLPPLLQENLAKLHFLSSIRTENVLSATDALLHLEHHTLYDEYTLRLQFLKESISL